MGSIKESHLYKILLDPALRQYMHEDLRDLRIYDSAHREVPYFVLCERALKSKADFVEYPILSQKQLKNYSEIIIHNPQKNKTGNIAFNINNSDAHKYCAIEGSDDRVHWFSVSALQELSLAYNGEYTNGYKCLYFPLSDYMYFRLLIENWHAQPLKINSAGYFKNSVTPSQFKTLKYERRAVTLSENKKTTVKLSFKGKQQIDRIGFKVGSPRLFRRHAIVYADHKRQAKHRIETFRENLFEFDFCSDDLDSGRVLLQALPKLIENELLIEIENKDNPPLDIKDVFCDQLATYVVCDLNANKGDIYTLKYGNDSLGLPEYDLSSFVPDNLQALPEAPLGPVKKIARRTISEKESLSFFETKQFLWLCLIFGALIVIFFSRSLLKDMRGKNH